MELRFPHILFRIDSSWIDINTPGIVLSVHTSINQPVLQLFKRKYKGLP